MLPALRVVVAGAACAVLAARAVAQPGDDADGAWNVHGQLTFVDQYHPSFDSPYRGTNSLDPGNSGRETVDLTLYAGVRPWRGGEIYLNSEIDQGYGLSNTLGAAGFPSGEAYKVGSSTPYYRTPRLFLRQVFDLGGDAQPVPDGANQLAGSRSSDNLILTAGKFSVVDVFDTNRYAHDPRADFLNWAVIESGAFDYAADAWGYSYGAAVEWTRSRWTLRGGAFALSRVPNQRELDRSFQQFQLVAEVEQRHAIGQRPGKLKLLVFDSRGRMGGYDAALDLAMAAGASPDTGAVRRMASRPGLAVNFEQEATAGVGLFARASLNDGSKEAFDFTEINRSLSAGASVSADLLGRPQDTAGVAAAVNGLSAAARRYLAAGGLGILIGDGRLPDYGLEKTVEAYYSARLLEGVTLSADFQYVMNPAYNADRGPVPVVGIRIHAEI